MDWCIIKKVKESSVEFVCISILFFLILVIKNNATYSTIYAFIDKVYATVIIFNPMMSYLVYQSEYWSHFPHLPVIMAALKTSFYCQLKLNEGFKLAPTIKANSLANDDQDQY